MVSDICMNVIYGRRACETGSGRSYGLVAFADAAWFFALTVVIWTLGEMLQSPSNAATVAALSPPMLRGRYQGLNSLNWSAGTALAPVLGGLTQEHLGDAALRLGCFGLCALVAAGHLVTGPRRERRIAQLLATPVTMGVLSGPPGLHPRVALPPAALPPAAFPPGELPPAALPPAELPPAALPPAALPPGELPLAELPLAELPPVVADPAAAEPSRA